MRLCELLAETAASSPLDNPAFRAWFGNSQIVDAQGNPQVLYHGTATGSLEHLQPSRGGEFGPGIYLTPDHGTAWFHADRQAGQDGGSTILPVYASIQNPFRTTKAEWIRMTQSRTPREVQKRLQAKGHDGIIGVGLSGMDVQIVVFRPEQVKSRFNAGTFDPASGKLSEVRDSVYSNVQDVRVPIHRNPSKTELEGLLNRTKYARYLRGLLAGTDVFVWDGGLATHYEIARFLGTSLADSYGLTVTDEGVKYLWNKYLHDDVDPEAMVQKIRDCQPNLTNVPVGWREWNNG